MKDWILSYFPPHKIYVEPFFGAGSVFFSKPRVSMEIVNDVDRLVFNFFSVLRDDSKELIRRIKNTPYAEEVLDKCLRIVADLKAHDLLNCSWAFYCICWMNIRANDCLRGASFRKKGNINSFGGHNPARLFSKLSSLVEARNRLRGVTISNITALNCIKIYDSFETLFYIDPPYLNRTRNTKNLYNNEFKTEEEHRQLLKAILKSKGMFVVSHYPDPLYDEMLVGWERVEKDTLSNNMTKGATKEDKTRTEALYLSPSVSAKIKGEMLPFT